MKPKLNLFNLAMLAALPGILAMRNDANQAIDALQNTLLNLNEQARSIVARADAENRAPTEDESKELDEINDQFLATEAEITRRNRVSEMSARTTAAVPRRVNAEVVEDPATAAAAGAGAASNAGSAGTARHAVRASGVRVPAEPRNNEDRNRWGFRSEAEYFNAVMRASAKGSTPDPRLIVNAVPSTFGSEGVGADGGFAIPPDFRQQIMIKVMGESSLLPLTDQQQSSSNSITFPADETTPWQTSGGIQALWEIEGGLKGQSKPQLTGKTVKLNKLICLVPMTDELLEDAPAMASYVNMKAPQKIAFKLNDAIVNGTGVGMPLGVLTSTGTVVVAEESGQTADTIVFANILKLYSSLTPSARKDAAWIVNPDTETQLMGMQFPGTGTAVPVFLPPGGLSGNPYGMLLGKPIIPTEACQALGTVGDIIFGDLNNYLSVVKAGGIRSDVSIHLWFDYDLTAFRFVLRMGGEPWWNAPILPFNSAARTRGFFATLATRA